MHAVQHTCAALQCGVQGEMSTDPDSYPPLAWTAFVAAILIVVSVVFLYGFVYVGIRIR